MKPNKAAVPVEHAQPGPDGYICQSQGVKFPGEPAAIDERVSTNPQADQEKDSLPHQRRLNEETAARLELLIVHDSAGPVSGAKEDADRLVKLYDLAEAGAILHVIFSAFDRAFRNVRLAETFVERMRLLDVHVWVEGKCISHARAHANTMNQIRHLMSEHERNVLRERAAKRIEYARKGTTYRRLAPPGFKLVPIPGTKKSQRLQVIPDEKDLFLGLFMEVSCNGPAFTYASSLGQELRERYPQIQSPDDLANLIRDTAYQGLNAHGAHVFKTPYTAENRVVSDDLFRNANQRALPPVRRHASLDELAGKVGATAVLDGFLQNFVVLCLACLAPVHRGRLQEHQSLVCPTLECRGTSLDFEALAKLQRQGRVEAGHLESALRTPGKVHETVIVPAAGQQDARGSLYRCDNCFEVRLSQFTVTPHGARKHLRCNTCNAGRSIPRYPWQSPPPRRPFKQSLTAWVPDLPKGPKRKRISSESKVKS